MKLRVRGETLRLRLTRSEVEALGAGQVVEERVPFPAGNTLVYQLRAADAYGSAMEQQGADVHIVVEVPSAVAAEWSGSEVVGLAGDDAISMGPLQVLIEKDFTCVTPREGEEELDTYPNPNVAAG